MRRLAFSLALLALAACSKPQQQEQPANAVAAQTPAAPEKIDRSHKGKPVPDVAFKDPDGGEISLANFRGAPVLLNLWASWCAPCVKELPTLDRLAKAHRDDGALGVIAVSQDNGPHASVQAFLDKLKVEDLGAYQDSSMALSGAFDAQVLPTSILIDADGKEVWRYVGDLDWTSPEAARLLAEAAAAKKG